MHPELLSALAAEHTRDLAACSAAARSAAARSAAARSAAARRPPPARARRRALPRFRVTWTRTTLAAVADRRRARSLVIVISATRTR